jgi:hypothetical protein
MMAMFWWKKQGKDKELKSGYLYAKKIRAELANPILANPIMEEFFGLNYEKASQDPYV